MQIENLLKIGKLPIIVGGTNYYIESLLWRVLVEGISGEINEEKNSPIVPCVSTIDKIKKESVSEHDRCVDFIPSDKGSDTSIQKMSPESKSYEGVNPNIFKKVESLVSQCKNYFCGSVGEKTANSNFSEAKNVAYCECGVNTQSGGSDEESSVNEIVISDDKNVGNSGKCDELMYERDKKRLRETPVESVERKKIKLEDEEVDVMDEEALENISSQKLYEKLKYVDPDMANQLHPNNKRKIIRSLQVFMQMGRKHSEILQEQRSAEGGSELGGPLRYPHSCILWLQCDQEVLDRRLDSRVDIMLEEGLVQELLDFQYQYNKQRLVENIEPDYTKGIFQSIGFKEFHEYLVLSPDDRKTEKGSKLFKLGVDALKLVTRRYARRQIRWITNRFLRRPQRQVPPVYGLDTTDPSLWNERVLEPAVQIVESMLKGEEPTQVKPLPIIEREVKNEIKTYCCDVCDRMFVGDIQWNDHLNSKKHRKVLKRKNMLDKC